MSTVISSVTGNLTAAGSWKLASVAGELDSQAGSTALTTGNLDSAAFVLEANEVDAVLVKLASRATGTPTNTITIHLRNSTTATNVLSLTINVSDLEACGSGAAAREGGWYLFKFGSTHTPNGTDSYVIRGTVSATTTAVSLYTNGTANNWTRQVRRTTTAAPAAGDKILIVGEWTAAATLSSFTITMDEIAATDYGAAGTTEGIPAISVSKGGTLTYGATAATNYILRISGYLCVYKGGTLNIGTVATPIPRDSTAVLEFDCAADGDFGLVVLNGGTFVAQGLSRTSGKNATWTLLTAQLTAGTNSATVADDTGWLTGDVVAIASTTKTRTECEELTLSGNAGASSLAFTGNAVSTHLGTAASYAQAEIVLLTRNVRIRSVSTTAMSFFNAKNTAMLDIDWVDFRYLSSSVRKNLLESATGATVAISYCVFRDHDCSALIFDSTAANGTPSVTIEHSCSWRTSVTTADAGFISLVASTGVSALVVNDCVGVYNITGTNSMFGIGDYHATMMLTNLRAVCGGDEGISYSRLSATDWLGATHGPFVAHGNGGPGVFFASGVAFRNWNFGSIVSWRNTGTGIEFGIAGGFHNAYFASVFLFGNTTANVTMGSVTTDVVFGNLSMYSDTGFGVSSGWLFPASGGAHDIRVETGDFGTASGILTTHSAADINFSNDGVYRLTLVNVKLSSTEFTNFANATRGSRIHMQAHDLGATDHLTKTAEGDLVYDTGTVDVSPSLKMTPSGATPIYRLKSNAGVRGRGFLVAVDSGQTVTVSVKVQKDGSYTGSAARLIVLGNAAIGITESVLDTHSIGSGSFETLTGTTGAAAANGVMEFIVDCDGSLGNIFVDTWTAS